MTLLDLPIRTIDGHETTLGEYGARALLVVNVASRCGLTPQYAALEELQRAYGDDGLTVVGVPCNQFHGQEPGSNEEIAEFCSTTYGVTFPLLDKVDVNGGDRHPLYAELVRAPYADGTGAGDDIGWNFEKFLIDSSGDVVARFKPQTTPDDPDVVVAVKTALS